VRILHLIPTFLGGGAERQLALMAGEHARQGVDVGIVYHRAGPNLELLKDAPTTLFPLAMRSNHDPLALWSIFRLIRSWRPDIVQTWLPQMDILGGVAARLAGVPHVLSERASALAYDNSWKLRMRRGLGCRARAVIANSKMGVDYWQTAGAHGQLHVVVNAITPFATGEVSAPRALRPPCLLSAGRLTAQKNLFHMVQAMTLALQAKPEPQAYLFGEGPQDAALRQMISQSGMTDRIRLMGYEKNLSPWYRHADVFVSVSDFEGNPNVVLEAASAGCPLVLSDIPEHREAIPADGALFVNGHDPQAIARALLEALTDRVAAARRAQAAKAAVAQLTVARQAAQYLRIYQTLL
jgi:glycosyltransferase involved in cell wall biosynthesis